MDTANVPMAWGLTRGMAGTLGVNLTRAVTEGWYSRSDLTRLVESCAACGLAAQCVAWLAVTPKAETLPNFCRNKSDIEVLGS